MVINVRYIYQVHNASESMYNMYNNFELMVVCDRKAEC